MYNLELEMERKNKINESSADCEEVTIISSTRYNIMLNIVFYSMNCT